ncbi:15-cis-phytoene desaturase, chloroplastic/chromoplastic [Magnolia sinica]|uniref:15-cis-phytoene desaturase, chloroplastic/chromoplastic n=1 Tax=Magnolia sinica TaxID=86752 RepID=UPI00265A1DED|nr:15-cis-phytoene desaturase, chloroplastic/chromoplastic [Magnolia sinica]
MNLVLSPANFLFPKTPLLPLSHPPRPSCKTPHKTLKPRAVQLESYPPPASDPPRRSDTGVLVIGAGLAGLAAATRLHASKIPFLLLEASDAVGGRVRTDTVDGFLLDRGFQIFITAYPEARKTLDYEALDLQKFYSGALVYSNGRFHTVSDPFRHFPDALKSLANPIGSVFDKLLIGAVRLRAVSRSDDEILTAEEIPIIELLRKTGFSDSIIDQFFRPFFGGIFFDRQLETTSRLFHFILKCLALGDNTLPAKGISSIPEQLAGKLPPDSVRLNSKVVSVDFANESEPPRVILQTGEILGGESGLIVAVEEPVAEKLLEGKIDKKPAGKAARGTACLYFSADRSPVRKPVLILNGSGTGIVNNMFFATDVAPSYAPEGKTLVSISVVGSCEDVPDEELTRVVIRELSGWYGTEVVESWKHLRTYRIGFAQPNQSPPTDLVRKRPGIGSGVYVCGDYRNSATFDGALVSGRRAAEALLKDRESFIKDRGLARVI